MRSLSLAAEKVWGRYTFAGWARWEHLLSLSDLAPLKVVDFSHFAHLSRGGGEGEEYTPFCAQMTRGWTATEIVHHCASSARVLRLGRIYSGSPRGSQGLDLETVRPGCDLMSIHGGCEQRVALATWRLAPALQLATGKLLSSSKERTRRGKALWCVHVRSGKGETPNSTPYIRSSVLPPLHRLLKNHTSPPFIYLSADLPFEELMKFAPAIPELRTLCSLARCAGARELFSGEEMARWTKDVGVSPISWTLRSSSSTAISTMLLDVAVCTLAQDFWQSSARKSSFAALVEALRRGRQGAQREACSAEDKAP